MGCAPQTPSNSLSRPATPPGAGASAAAMLQAGEGEGYSKALEPREFEFPADHGPHPDFRTEWWYLTGHLDAEGGRQLGFQATFFRSALSPPADSELQAGVAQDTGTDKLETSELAHRSGWRTNQVYLAHVALTDLEQSIHRSDSRIGRGAVQLAGAQADPFRVWVGAWSLSSTESSFWPLDLDIEASALTLDLELGLDFGLERGLGGSQAQQLDRTWVLHGDRGLSAKSTEPGNASYYYSLTRMQVVGSVRSGEERLAVTGYAWLDREWSTSALSAEQGGWDWVSIQLDDNRELMLFRLRPGNEHFAGPAEAGTWVEADGSYRALPAGWGLWVPGRTWTSPRSGASYPVEWRLEIPQEGLYLDLKPLIDDQELDVGFRYWEGAMNVTGRQGEKLLEGKAYLEMTGYGEEVSTEGQAPSP